MKYYKNTELAKLYNISEKSVRNWIDATQKGRLDLELFESNGKEYIANTSRNTPIIKDLVKKGKKYKNSRGFKTVAPSEKFYKMYTPEQVLDIIASLEIYREIPHKYSYVDGGAEEWDQYSKRLLEEDGENTLKRTIFLLEINFDYIDTLLADYEKINVIDLGAGNAMPVRGLLEHLQEKGKLGRYIDIDISNDMLDIAHKNITSWFGDQVNFEGYTRDFSRDRFEDLLMSESFGAGNTTLNMLLLFGGTLTNLRDPDHALAIVHENMGKNDLLLYAKKPDTESARRYFDFTVGPGGPKLDVQDRLVLELFNLKEEYYSVEHIFDEKSLMRQISVRMNVAIAIEFEMDGRKQTVEISKGDSILLWRSYHQNVLSIFNQFDRANFELLQATTTPDQEHLLTVNRVRTGR